MYDDTKTMANNNNISMPMEAVKTKPNPKEAVEDFTSRLLNDFNVEEQKEILLATRQNLTRHYEELRQNHLNGAEDYAKRIEVLQN